MAFVRLSTSFDAHDAALLAAACQTDYNNVYITTRSEVEVVWVCGDAGVTENVQYATDGLLECLRQWYDVVAEIRPMLNVVPLFECTGWTLSKAFSDVCDLTGLFADRVADMPHVEVLITSESYYAEDISFVQHFNKLRNRKHLDTVSIVKVKLTGGFDVARCPREDDMYVKVLSYDQVVVGGTFDHLHAGHRLLLAASAIVAHKKLLIGITDDQYLLKKRFRERIQSLDDRLREVNDFVLHVRPELRVVVSVLTDPHAPVLAESDPSFQAIIVSSETKRGGEAVNDSRIQRGYPPLSMIVVGLVGSDGHSKLSSTALRQI